MSDTTSPSIETIRRHWAFRLITIVVPAVLSAILAYTGADATTREATSVVKNKAESGYQFTREALFELRRSNLQLQERLLHLETEIVALKRALLRAQEGKRITVKPAPPPPPPREPAVRLPADLDKALIQQQAKVGAP